MKWHKLLRGIKDLIGIIIALIGTYVVFKVTLKILGHQYTALSVMRGGFWATAVFFAVFISTGYFGYSLGLKKAIFRFDHDLIQVCMQDVSIRQGPSFLSKILKRADKDDFLFPLEETRSETVMWNKVIIDREINGWIVRTIPEKMGVPEKQASRLFRFQIYTRDLLALLFSMGGFLWGFLTDKTSKLFQNNNKLENVN
jgi:hypothetical protein